MLDNTQTNQLAETIGSASIDGEHAQALAAVRNVQANPESSVAEQAEALFTLARVLHRMQQYGGASWRYGQVAELFNEEEFPRNHAMALRDQAVALLGLKGFEELKAEEILGDIVASEAFKADEWDDDIDGFRPSVHLLRLQALRRLGKDRLAFALAGEVIELYEKPATELQRKCLGTAYLVEAAFYRTMQREDRAIRVLKVAIYLFADWNDKESRNILSDAEELFATTKDLASLRQQMEERWRRNVCEIVGVART